MATESRHIGISAELLDTAINQARWTAGEDKPRPVRYILAGQPIDNFALTVVDDQVTVYIGGQFNEPEQPRNRAAARSR